MQPRLAVTMALLVALGTLAGCLGAANQTFTVAAPHATPGQSFRSTVSGQSQEDSESPKGVTHRSTETRPYEVLSKVVAVVPASPAPSVAAAPQSSGPMPTNTEGLSESAFAVELQTRPEDPTRSPQLTATRLADMAPGYAYVGLDAIQPRCAWATAFIPFPLTAGKGWHDQWTEGGTGYTYDGHVEGREDVTVGSHTYPAVHLAMDLVGTPTSASVESLRKDREGDGYVVKDASARMSEHFDVRYVEALGRFSSLAATLEVHVHIEATRDGKDTPTDQKLRATATETLLDADLTAAPPLDAQAIRGLLETNRVDVPTTDGSASSGGRPASNYRLYVPGSYVQAQASTLTTATEYGTLPTGGVLRWTVMDDEGVQVATGEGTQIRWTPARAGYFFTGVEAMVNGSRLASAWATTQAVLTQTKRVECPLALAPLGNSVRGCEGFSFAAPRSYFVQLGAQATGSRPLPGGVLDTGDAAGHNVTSDGYGDQWFNTYVAGSSPLAPGNWTARLRLESMVNGEVDFYAVVQPYGAADPPPAWNTWKGEGAVSLAHLAWPGGPTPVGLQRVLAGALDGSGVARTA